MREMKNFQFFISRIFRSIFLFSAYLLLLGWVGGKTGKAPFVHLLGGDKEEDNTGDHVD